jgi:hypothetical protein
MSPETLAAISRPLLPLESFVDGYNQRVGAMLQAVGGLQ